MRISVMRTIGVLALAAMLFASVNALAQFGGLLGTSRPTPAISPPSTFSNFAVGEAYMNEGIASNYATGSGYLND